MDISISMLISIIGYVFTKIIFENSCEIFGILGNDDPDEMNICSILFRIAKSIYQLEILK